MAQRRDRLGRFAGAGGGSSIPRGTVAKGGGGTRGSVARSVAAQGTARPNTGAKPRLQPKAGAKQVMKEGIGSPTGKARANWIKATAAERKAKKGLVAANKMGKSGKAQIAQAAAAKTYDKASSKAMKAMDAFQRVSSKKR
jgi:hypothetical protein